MMKSVFYNRTYINLKKIEKICDKYDYISFDVFDTLLKRNVSSPQSIFEILDEIGKKNNIVNFKKIRVDSEIEFRKTQPFVTIDEIYQKIAKKIGKDKSKLMMVEEINLEKSYCIANTEIVNLMNKLKKKGKKIIAISDMYLTSKNIDEILKENGIFIDKIFVSCECKEKKRTGKLFEHVLEHEKIDNNKIVHIGDNIKADYYGAILAKIKTIHIKNKKKYFNCNRFYNKVVEKDKMDAFLSVINNNIGSLSNYYEKIGFSYLGPMLYNYCIWLDEQCEKNNLNKLYFFARDGYIIKKVFDILYPNKYETHYIYLSRRAIRIPFSSINLEFEEFIKYIPKTKMTTVGVLLECFGLDSSNYTSLLNKYNLNLKDTLYYDDLLKDDKYKEIFENLKEDIKIECDKELVILKEYLLQEKFYGKLAVIDVGWHNSIQYYLEKIFESEHYDVNMYGLYLGLQSGEKKVRNSYSFISDTMISKYVDSVKSFVGLMESLFLAKEGSTIRFEKKDDKIIPVKLNYEYDIDDNESKSFSAIHDGAINFINIVKELKLFEIYKLNGYDAYLPLKTFGLNPYLFDVKMFSKFRYFSEDITFFSNSKGFFKYLTDLKSFKKDFLNSRWKIGFMKETFVLKMPYYSLYRKYKKLKGWY